MEVKAKQKPEKEKKHLKTFSIHEKDLKVVQTFKKAILQYKHVENMLNLLVAHEFDENGKKEEKSRDYKIFKLLLNRYVMKAVLKGNPGAKKTSHDIAFVNRHFASHVKHDLFVQLIQGCVKLNDKNLGEIVNRLHKDWDNFFKALKTLKNNTSTKNPSHPKPKKLSKVFNYSVPLEVSKFSLAKEKQGLLGINLSDGMVYVKYFHVDKSKDNLNKPEYLNKDINSITVALSHGHIYYQLQYKDKTKEKVNTANEGTKLERPVKSAGLDIGLNNIANIFINDEKSPSLVISGGELISYNCNFNKRLSKNAESLNKEVLTYKTLVNKKGQEQKIPQTYSKKGKSLKYRRSQLFERRKLFMDDYMNKLSKKITQYAELTEVTDFTLSKNLSLTKTDGTIKMGKKTKQKFYQIPLGKLLNLLESKLSDKNIKVKWIDEAYTSKTSSLTADVNKNQAKSLNQQQLLPADFNGSRGSKKKGQLNNPLGRGLFKDSVLNKVVHADLNAAANHIKVGNKNTVLCQSLWKYCNPKKIKSNHEFDRFLKSYRIVDIQRPHGVNLT